MLFRSITAGIGSDHVDLQAAMDNKVDVVEVTYCNSISVSEHIVMIAVQTVRLETSPAYPLNCPDFKASAIASLLQIFPRAVLIR